MRMTVLGKSPSWQDADGACSGYLLEEGDTCVLVDCGNGVFSKLRCVCDYVDVDAVLISHLHADHFLDLLPFSYGLTYAPRQQPVAVAGWAGTDHPARPDLYAPNGAADVFRQITSTFGLSETVYVLMGVVLGGLNRPIPATLGGFSIGFAFGLLGGILPTNQSQYLPSFIFAAVIVVLLVRPNGLFTRGGAAVERV